ncbi:MAG: TetR/AcrR family transcriptional regulator [Terracidiphilus sp.]
MTTPALTAFEPRKTPVQARAAVTVGAICEAAIQVLLSHGADRLTTTRVADRAGVSVGTLYQYFPNKQALLFAVFEAHMENVTGKVEAACSRAQRKPLAEMMREVVEAFVDAKMERADISVALYRVAAEVDGSAAVKRSVQRSRKTIEAMLHTAPNLDLLPDRFAIDIMLAAISGVMRAALESGGSPATLRKLKEHLVLLCQSYMAAALTKRR